MLSTISIENWNHTLILVLKFKYVENAWVYPNVEPGHEIHICSTSLVEQIKKIMSYRPPETPIQHLGLRQNIESRIQHQNADVHLCLAPCSVEHTREPAYKRTIVHYAYVSTSVPCSSPHVLLESLHGINFVTWPISSNFPPWIVDKSQSLIQNPSFWLVSQHQICGGNIKLISWYLMWHRDKLGNLQGFYVCSFKNTVENHLIYNFKQLLLTLIYKYAGG